MVCLGNICRSPMADGLMRHKISREGMPIEVDSAGTAAYHVGEAPDSRMRVLAKEKGTPIDNLRARQFRQEDFKEFDFIYAMDRQNYTDILALTSDENDRKKVKLILSELPADTLTDVPDPYYGSRSDFEAVYKLLDEVTDHLINTLKNA